MRGVGRLNVQNGNGLNGRFGGTEARRDFSQFVFMVSVLTVTVLFPSHHQGSPR